MAYQSLELGTTADDGTGDSLRVGGDKVNDIYAIFLPYLHLFIILKGTIKSLFCAIKSK